MVNAMPFNIPKDDAKYRWTNHVVRKMIYYGLSADRVKRVIRVPKRMEEGIAPGTMAAMQEAGNKKKPTEIWAMWALKGRQKIVITAWRYPGVSPVRSAVPIPSDILAELKNEGMI